MQFYLKPWCSHLKNGNGIASSAEDYMRLQISKDWLSLKYYTFITWTLNELSFSDELLQMKLVFEVL